MPSILHDLTHHALLVLFAHQLYDAQDDLVK
jgi:hypothetical protein